jgi:hypothetical protein
MPVLSVLLAFSLLPSACLHVAENGAAAGDASDTEADTDTISAYDLDAGLRCDGGVDLMQPAPDGEGEIPTGVEQCPDSSWHRYAAVPCTDSTLDAEECTGADACDECPPDQICIEVGWLGCACITPCASDADCEHDRACLCHQAGTTITHCAPADCRTDDDCGGFECGVSRDGCHIANRLSCRTEADVCHGDAQCDGHFCSYVEDVSRWECIEPADCE